MANDESLRCCDYPLRKGKRFEGQEGSFRRTHLSAARIRTRKLPSLQVGGSYEPDVLDFIEDQVGASDIFVDLGSGDGFFCAGVAKIGEVKVIGYETNSFERRLALDLARVNRVEMDIRGLATPRELDTLPEGRLLLLSDVEGFEEDLLDPEECERLKAATLVVEVHEMIRPNVVRVLKERFDGTHTITRVFAQVSDVGNFSELEAWVQNRHHLPCLTAIQKAIVG